LYKNTISNSIPESIFAKKPSFFVRNASFISRFIKLRLVAFRILLVTVKPMRKPVWREGDEHTKAFIGLLSYFVPRVITLVKDSNPLSVFIDGCIRGKNASSFRQIFSIFFHYSQKVFFCLLHAVY
jgi:hypothetical protein